MTAEQILARVLEAGGTWMSDSQRPRIRYPRNLRAMVEANRAVLRHLVEGLSIAPPEISRRAADFRGQVSAWVSSGRAGVPLLVLPDAPVPRLGRCVSCGEPISKDQWRCRPCLLAVYLALDTGGTSRPSSS